MCQSDPASNLELENDLNPCRAAVGPHVTPCTSLGLSMIGLEDPAQWSRAELTDTDLSPNPDSFSGWAGS